VAKENWVRKMIRSIDFNGELYNGAWDLDTLLGALDEESVFSWSEANK
jgi:hypothetical protein